jgi:hypothetical protein
MRRLLPTLLLSAFPLLCPAQQPTETSTVAAERAAFHKQVLSESQLLTEQYERALAKLEGELAVAADYEEARLVRQRRAELKALYAPGDSTFAQTLATPLAPSQARLTGSAEARGEELTGWRTGGSVAEWANVRLTTGRFHLELEASMTQAPAAVGGLAPNRAASQERASFEFYEVSLLPGAQENRRTFEVLQSSDGGSFVPLRIGPVNFTRSPVTLRLASVGGYPGNVLRLRNLRLVPVTEEEIVAAPSLPASAIALSDARQKLALELAAAQRPVVTEHLATLRQLATADAAVRPEAEAEIKRLQKMLETSRNDGTAILRLYASRGGVAGFENLDHARFVNDPENTGDTFVIEHDGERQKVRLMWVQAPPLDEKDTGRKVVAKHFGIDEDALTGLARLAQEFTGGYLEGKSLRLLIRPGKDKDGISRALLFLPEIGLYQNVLVDQGLAAVQPPPKDMRLPAMERALLSFLTEREEFARRQRTGAWALTEDRRK